MSAQLWSTIAIRTGLFLVTLVGCNGGDSTGVSGPPGPTVGTLAITIVTTGSDPDLQGYTLTFRGFEINFGSPLPIDTLVRVLDLAPGDGEVLLGDLADNCSVIGINPASVLITVGDQTDITFTIACVQSGSIQVVATTTGLDPDLDGYVFQIDTLEGHRGTLGEYASLDLVDLNGSSIISRLRPGSRTVTLTAVAHNCSVTNGLTRTVTVVAGSVVPVPFDVNCVRATDRAIAFAAADSGGNTDIYVRHSDGRGIERLTTDPGEDRSPAWSPDYSTMAFASNRTGRFAIYTMDATGGNVRPVTNGSRDDRRPAWSPDGASLAFVGDTAGHEANIYRVNPDGSGLTNLTHSADSESEPQWSPDGTKLVFSRAGEILTMAADGGGPVILIAGVYPRWSPDGSLIAFEHVLSSDWYWICFSSVNVIHPDGSNVQNVGCAGLAQVSWAPDSRRIAFSKLQSTVVVGLDGTATLISSVNTREVAWAPEGSEVAASASAPCPVLELLDAGGLSPLVLTTNTLPCGFQTLSELAWGPVE
ncbi:MAG: hypothetical protein ABI836_12305 [Gemmatimonadota bacterium]